MGKKSQRRMTGRTKKQRMTTAKKIQAEERKEETRKMFKLTEKMITPYIRNKIPYLQGIPLFPENEETEEE